MSLRAKLAVLASVGLSGCCLTPVGPPDAGVGLPPPDAGIGLPAFDGGPAAKCTIGGATYGAGLLRPTNRCQSCQPAVDPTDWTNLPAGTACAADGLCDSKGACIAPACKIGGVVYPRGAAKPQDPSSCCSPSLNRSDWSFRLQDGGTYQANQTMVTAVAVADFNGDGRKDLAVMCGDFSERYPNYRSTVNIWLGQAGGLEGPSVFDACPLCSRLQVADLNGDGYPDLVVPAPPNWDPSSAVVIVFLNSGDGTGSFGRGVPRALLPIDSYGGPLLRDLDHDGIVDLAYGGSAVYFLKGLGDGGFADPVAYPLGEATFANSIVAGDFRGDGILDLVTTNASDSSGSGSITVLTGDGKGGFSPKLVSLGSPAPELIVAGDFNGDGLLDLGFSDSLLGVGFFPRAANGTFGPAVVEGTVVGAPVAVAVADLDANGLADFIVADINDRAPVLRVLWSNADNTVTESSLPFASNVDSILAADLNGDGTPDIVVGTEAGAVNMFVNGCP